MADGQHKLSRRALLGAVCAAPVLSRHPELVSGSRSPPPGCMTSWTLNQVQGDEADESFAAPIWDRTLARFQKAQAAVDAASGEPDQDRYIACPERLPWQAVEGPSSTPPPRRCAPSSPSPPPRSPPSPPSSKSSSRTSPGSSPARRTASSSCGRPPAASPRPPFDCFTQRRKAAKSRHPLLRCRQSPTRGSTPYPI